MERIAANEVCDVFHFFFQICELDVLWIHDAQEGRVGELEQEVPALVEEFQGVLKREGG